MIYCPECKKQISDKAEACPHCGLPRKYFADQEPAKENTSTKSSEATVEPDYKSIRNMLIAYPRDYNKTIVYNKTNIPTVFYSIGGIIMFAGFIDGCIVAQQQNNYRIPQISILQLQ